MASLGKEIEFLNESNNTKDRKQISTWDLIKLYTIIPFDQLKDKVAIFSCKINIVLHSKKAISLHVLKVLKQHILVNAIVK